ncbi:hypothetical protein AMTRI_Chr04g245590 [Amborella trichopoda]
MTKQPNVYFWAMEMMNLGTGCGIPWPRKLSRLKNLQTLDLSWNSIEGAMPDLSWNSIEGAMPLEIGLLSGLETLDLSGNQLRSIPFSLGNLSHFKEFDLSYNQFNGTIPHFLGSLSSLEAIHLTGNEFRGRLTQILGNLSSLHTVHLNNLKHLVLSNNSLSGGFPRELGELQHLVELDLSTNSLSSIVSLSPLANLSVLQNVDLSRNSRLVKLSAVSPFQLSEFRLSYCDLSKFNTSVLGLVLPQPSLETLDISNSKSRGEIPKNFFTDLPRLKELNMCCNSLSGGTIDSSISRLHNLLELDLTFNNFSGGLPSNLTNTLEVLDLCLNLANNNLEGPLISENFDPTSLMSLHLNRNAFNGTTPKSLLAKNNNMSGVIPKEIENLGFLQVLILKRNDFQGNIPYSFCRLQGLGILDLFQNKFRVNHTMRRLVGFVNGNNPIEVMNFYKGYTHEYRGDVLASLTGIDLFSNQLSGRIPREMNSPPPFSGPLFITDNDLEGSVPCEGQLSTFRESSYRGNPKLYGFQGDECSHLLPIVPQRSGNKEEEDGTWIGDKPIFYACIAGGFIVGYCGVIVSLFLKKQWRIVYFGRIDKVLHQISSIY